MEEGYFGTSQYDIEICMFCGDTNHGRDYASTETFSTRGLCPHKPSMYGYFGTSQNDIEICMFCGDTNHGREAH